MSPPTAPHLLAHVGGSSWISFLKSFIPPFVSVLYSTSHPSNSFFCSLLLSLFFFQASNPPYAHSGFCSSRLPPLHALFLCLVHHVPMTSLIIFDCDSCFSGSNNWQLTFSSQVLGLNHIVQESISRENHFPSRKAAALSHSVNYSKVTVGFLSNFQQYGLCLICRTVIFFLVREKWLALRVEMHLFIFIFCCFFFPPQSMLSNKQRETNRQQMVKDSGA